MWKPDVPNSLELFAIDAISFDESGFSKIK